MAKKTVLITGSNRGLGKSLAQIFSEKGYDIILHGRKKKELNQVKKEVLKNNVSCKIVSGDISKRKTINELAKVAKKEDLDILINNAGIMSQDFLPEIKDEEIEKVLEVNLSSIIKLTKRIYSFFSKKKSGMIININSTAGMKPSEKRTLYSASKYGLKGFTDCLRLEAKKNNIRVLSVHPGGMQTRFFDRVGGKDVKKAIKTEEVAEIIFNLVGYDSAHIDEIVIDRMYR